MLFIMQLVLFSLYFFLCIVVLLLANNNDEIFTLQVTESSPMLPGFELSFGNKESSKEKTYLKFGNRNFILVPVLCLGELEEENVD